MWSIILHDAGLHQFVAVLDKCVTFSMVNVCWSSNILMYLTVQEYLSFFINNVDYYKLQFINF